MQYAIAHQGRPRGIVKFAPLFLIVLLVIFGYAAYLVIEKEVTIVVDGAATHVKTLKSDVASVLEEENIKLYPKDLITPGLTSKLEEGQVITVTRAFNVTLEVDGKKTSVLTLPKTVQEILDQANVALGEKDIVEPALSALVDKNTNHITINRITEKLITKKELIAFRIEQKEDPTLERGIRRIIQQGKDGSKEDTIKITYQDGKEINREVIGTKILQEPKNQVISQGVLQYASRGGTRFEFSRAIEVKASAYTYTGSRTSAGTNPKVGTVAVDPLVIPMGSRLYVEGYGFGRAEDTGSAITGNRIDLFLETEQECRRWGRRSVKVYILK
ncbi:MAG: ubiquitin-like domain-containing protein [Dehalobacterium sp.]